MTNTVNPLKIHFCEAIFLLAMDLIWVFFKSLEVNVGLTWWDGISHIVGYTVFAVSIYFYKRNSLAAWHTPLFVVCLIGLGLVRNVYLLDEYSTPSIFYIRGPLVYGIGWVYGFTFLFTTYKPYKKYVNDILNLQTAGLGEKENGTEVANDFEPAEELKQIDSEIANSVIVKSPPEEKKEEFIRFECVCGKKIKVAMEYAGKIGKCPGCQRRLRVPSK